MRFSTSVWSTKAAAWATGSMKDVGFGMTVQDKNAPDLVPLYKISDEMGMEFATASLHNSFYFVEAKNIIHDRSMVAKNFENVPLFFANLSDAYAVRGTNKSCPTEGRCYECSSSCCTRTWNQFCRTDCSCVGYEENKIFRVLFVSQ